MTDPPPLKFFRPGDMIDFNLGGPLLKTIVCKILGHKWRPSGSAGSRQFVFDVVTCRRCGRDALEHGRCRKRRMDAEIADDLSKP